MELRIPRLQALATLVVCLVGVAVFVYLMGRFGGPELSFDKPYELTATVQDSEGISKKSDVLIRGVRAGEVTRMQSNTTDSVRIHFQVFDRYRRLVRRDATVRMGDKTLLGETFVDLVPGSRASPAMPAGAKVRALQSNELDEALQPLVGAGGRSMRSLIHTFGRGARSPATPERVNLTFAELDRLVGELRGLTETLKGQEGNIAAGVRDTHTVLTELGERQGQVATIVSGGRATLGALASRRAALEQGLAELPALLATGRQTLRRAQPLLQEARPLMADLRAASPELTPALRDLRPVARDARRVVEGLPRFNRTAVPFLRRATPVVGRARPVARGLDPVARNLVPILDYLAPRKKTFVSWFSNTYGIRSDKPDSVGEWARFLLFMEDKTAFGVDCHAPDCRDVQSNPYADRDDEPRLQPYRPGSYPRLRPFTPSR